MNQKVLEDGPFYESTTSPELIEAFEKSAVQLICSESRVLFNAGESGSGIYLVQAGEVRLMLPLTQMDGMGFRARAGSFVGLPATFSDEPYSMTAVAREGAQLAVMSRERFCDLISSSPALALEVLKILAAETRAARIAIVEAGIGRRKSLSR